jgi:hypothetical protein
MHNHVAPTTTSFSDHRTIEPSALLPLVEQCQASGLLIEVQRNHPITHDHAHVRVLPCCFLEPLLDHARVA